MKFLAAICIASRQIARWPTTVCASWRKEDYNKLHFKAFWKCVAIEEDVGGVQGDIVARHFTHFLNF